MPKRSSKELSDRIQNAFRVQESIEEHETALTILGNRSLLSRVMAEIGRKGGKIGGKVQAHDNDPGTPETGGSVGGKETLGNRHKGQEKDVIPLTFLLFMLKRCSIFNS